ncbi:hypothetical protein [Nitrosomonas sp.]|uniref:hypothetical protein n=1 Tax=Nitrosomonas sp. TaxID=42353 RepID=UPI0032F03383
MRFNTISAAITVCLFFSACSTNSTRTETPSPQEPTPATSTSGETRTVKSRDGSYTGEIIGTPAAGSKFSQLQIGMQTMEIQKMIGFPDESHSYESGKRWIPFYFGNDARRMQVLYKDEGCLIFTDGGHFNSGGDLIQIQVDPSGACYEP